MAMISDASLEMGTEAARLAFARDVLRIEAEAIDLVRDRLDGTIARAADRLHRCRGVVIITGMGKAGIVGQKLAATLASTGTRAFPLHPAEAIHGDLGRVQADDVVIALSQSGETEEVFRLVPALRRLGACLISITGRADEHAGPGQRPLRRARADRGGLPAGPGPVGEHHGDDGRRRRPGAAGQPDARLPRRGLRPEPPGRPPGPAAGLRRGPDADRSPAPQGPSARPQRPRGVRRPGRAEAAVGRRPDRRRRGQAGSGSSPIPTSPDSSSGVRTITSTGRSAR